MRISDWSSDVCSSDLLPDGETHEIGLLFANYLLKARGQHVLYLGSNLKLPDLEQIVGYYHPHYVLTALTSDTQFGDLSCLVRKIQEVIPGVPLLLTGQQTKCNKLKENEYLHTLRDIQIGRASCRERVCQYV